MKPNYLTLSSSKRFWTFSFCIAADISATCFCTAGSAIAAFRASGSGTPGGGMLAALQICESRERGADWARRREVEKADVKGDDRATVDGNAARPLQLTAEEPRAVQAAVEERGVIIIIFALAPVRKPRRRAVKTR